MPHRHKPTWFPEIEEPIGLKAAPECCRAQFNGTNNNKQHANVVKPAAVPENACSCLRRHLGFPAWACSPICITLTLIWSLPPIRCLTASPPQCTHRTTSRRSEYLRHPRSTPLLSFHIDVQSRGSPWMWRQTQGTPRSHKRHLKGRLPPPLPPLRRRLKMFTGRLYRTSNSLFQEH